MPFVYLKFKYPFYPPIIYRVHTFQSVLHLPLVDEDGCGRPCSSAVRLWDAHLVACEGGAIIE